MNAVLEVNHASPGVSPQPEHALDALPPGRRSLVARCLGEVEPLLVEKRNNAIAIKIRGRWYAVDPGGTFKARIRESDGRVNEIGGTVRLTGRQLFVAAVESVLTTGECKRWTASVDLYAGGPERHQVVLLGRAYSSFAEGPTEAPLRVEVDLITRGQRAILLPAALTNRGELEIPILPDGSFRYRADGTALEVDGRLERHRLELTIETAGDLGWTRKELSAAF